MYNIALVGNPNCGKTTLFNALTGSKQHIGNWPGVTVEKKEGVFKLVGGEEIKVVDLPGVYSLTAASEDERATRDYVLSHDAELFVNVVDATNIERNLYLTLLLIELRVPMIVVVTMMDIAKQRLINIDLEHLAAHLTVPVIGVNATLSSDISRLGKLIAEAKTNPITPSLRIEYPNELYQELDILESASVKTAAALGVRRHWVALKAIEGDPFIIDLLNQYHDMAPEVVNGAIERCSAILHDPPDVVLADTRYGVISGLYHDVVRISLRKTYWSDQIDHIIINRFLGIPLFFLIMFIVFWLTQVVGGACIEAFDDAWEWALLNWLAPLTKFPIAAAILAGFHAIIAFIPPIFFMFLCLSILEDSGYMARAAFVMDRFMRWLGLPGKSFVPLLVGFGCTVPAIMATRTLESRRDRRLTIFMTPFMSCGAKLPVYTIFGAAFFDAQPGRMVFWLYLTGILLGILTGLAMKTTLFRGTPSPFIMELPPYHLPRPRHILIHTWERLRDFIFRAGKFILPMVVVLSLLNTFGLIENIGKLLIPLFRPLGVADGNWPASVAIFTGLFAKESVIATLTSFYEQSGTTLLDHFTLHQAYAYLLFVLLYVPCLAATGVALRELGKLYGAIFIAYLTLLGWSVATIYYQIVEGHSILWSATAILILALMYTAFAIIGKRKSADN